jgi:Fe-S-cluster-containing hydrogenase component 2
VQRCKNHALSLQDGKSVVDAEKCALCGYCAAVCPQFCIKVI